MKTLILIAASGLIATSIFSCDSAQDRTRPMAAPIMKSPQIHVEPVSPEPSSSYAGFTGTRQGEETETQADGEGRPDRNAPKQPHRAIIKTAVLDMTITSFARWSDTVMLLANHYGGYTLNSSSAILSDSGNQSGQMTIRVPSKHYTAFVMAIKKTADTLRSFTETGQDVTEELYDISARLANKRRTEARIQSVLQRANSIKDIFKVEREIDAIREQIERMEGRQRYLGDRTSFSTLTVNWREPGPQYRKPVVVEEPGFFAVIADGFVSGTETFANVLSSLISFSIGALPIIVLAIIVVWLVMWLSRRMYRHGPKEKDVNLNAG